MCQPLKKIIAMVKLLDLILVIGIVAKYSILKIIRLPNKLVFSKNNDSKPAFNKNDDNKSVFKRKKAMIKLNLVGNT